MANALFAILVALVLAFFFSEILRFFKIPRVIGQISAGIILGLPALKGLFFTNDVLSVFEFIANIGIILLFFFLGLEINLIKFRKNFKETSLIAVFNTLLPMAGGFLAGKFLFKFDNIASLVIGISLSVSSQAISLDILEELKLLKSKIGNLILASGTVDDIFELLFVSALLVVFQSAVSGQADLLKLGFDILGFILVVIMFRIALVPIALKIFEKEKSQSSLFMGALIIVLLVAYISELAGIGSLIGALIAGILVRQSLLSGEERKPWEKNEISHTIHIMSFGFLIPLFFVNVGLNTDLSVISSSFFLVFVLIIIDIAGTLLGTVVGVISSKGTLKEGLIVGWGVTPKGDTEIVIATLALSNGLINTQLFSAIIAVALFTTFIAPIMFQLLIKKHASTIS